MASIMSRDHQPWQPSARENLNLGPVLRQIPALQRYKASEEGMRKQLADAQHLLDTETLQRWDLSCQLADGVHICC